MSLDEETEDRDVIKVLVNEAEYQKFCYLVKVMDAVDRTHGLARGYLKELQSSEGSQGYMDFNWSEVSKFVAPQLQLVFLRDRERDPYLQRFMQFPFAAIVARTAVVVELDSVFELSLGDTDAYQGVTEVTNAFRVLEATVQSLGGRRMSDGEKTLNQLKRLLKLEL